MKFKAYDRLHQDVKDVAIINFVEKTCYLWIESDTVRMTIARDFEDIILLKCPGKKCSKGNELSEGDIITSVLTDIRMIIRYGEYEAYCPADRQNMKNIGFYVTSERLPDMPLGPTEEYAIRKGSIFDKPCKEQNDFKRQVLNAWQENS